MNASSSAGPTRLRLAAVLLCLGTWPAVAEPAAEALALRSTWECLPEDTLVAARMPDGVGFLDTIRTRTRFGTVVLDRQRLERLARVIGPKLAAGWMPGADRMSPVGSDGVDLEEWLRRYGLEVADLWAGLKGESGLALVLRPGPEGRPPRRMILAWTDPGPEVAARLLAALAKRLDEPPGPNEEPIKRVDLQMAGHDVMWLSAPTMRLDLGELPADLTLDATGIEVLRKELADRAKTAPRVRVGQVETFVALMGGRLIAGQTAIPSEAGADGAAALEEARELFARLVADHEKDGPAALPETLRTTPLRGVLPDPTATVDMVGELVVDPRVLLRTLTADGEARRQFRSIGIDTLGPCGWRAVFDEGWLRQGGFVSLPAPRRGLARILEQDGDVPEVPAFVTSEATEVLQMSLDLGAAYREVREFAMAEGGEQAGNLVNALEMQVQGWTGIDLPTLLSALGSRHWMLTYPTDVAAMVTEARKTRTEEGLQALPPGDRSCFVWQVADEAPFMRILQRVAPLIGGTILEEQGFQGVRGPGGVAAFVGRNHLVITFGADTAESTLAAIRNPPSGEAALRDSPAVRRARDVLAPIPGRVFSAGDASRTGGMVGELRAVVARLEPADLSADYRDIIGKLQALLPSADAVEGLFGGSATSVEVTPEGLAFRSVWEMPPP
jgi:hypothetical protein